MWKWLIRNRLNAFEKQFGYDTSYMREVLAIDTAAFLAFARVSKIAHYRRDVAKEPHYAAKLVGTLAEDCGPCTQLNVTMALQDGADPKTIAAVLANDERAMTPDVRLAVRFARATLAHDPSADALRDDVVKRWGPRGLLSLAFGLTAARMFPTLKYALGHGKTCQRVDVAGTPITVVRSAA
jgi:hypothetical protein